MQAHTDNFSNLEFRKHKVIIGSLTICVSFLEKIILWPYPPTSYVELFLHRLPVRLYKFNNDIFNQHYQK